MFKKVFYMLEVLLEVIIYQIISFIPEAGINWYYTINMVAGEGFEPSTFGLWARRATWLLHPATRGIMKESISGARDRVRTGDPQLGRLMLYQLSSSRLILSIILDAKPAFCQYIYFREVYFVIKIMGAVSGCEKIIKWNYESDAY